MNKSKIILSLVTSLIIAALLLAGCGKTAAPTTAPPTTAPPVTTAPPTTTVAPTTAVVPTTTAPPATTRPAATTAPPAATTAPPATAPSDMVKVTLTKVDGTTMEKTLQKPKYGGTISYVDTDPLFFDDYFGGATNASTVRLTNDRLAIPDWSLGAGGTGERSFLFSITPRPNEIVRPGAGGVAEKFEFVDPDTVKVTIRKGIRFALNPKSEAARLVNGRELIADDVAFSIRRNWTGTRAGGAITYPGQIIFDETKAIDRYTFVIKWAPGKMPVSWNWATTNVPVWPREAAEKFTSFGEWQNSVGSGPFILTDYVKASFATFVRNPDWWMKDPIFKENQLPYPDGVQTLYIVDKSTQMAALRTAKVDLMRGLTIDDYQSLKTAAALKVFEVPGGPLTVYMRVDKPELPWYDKRVRNALSMALDRETVKSQLYSGYARIADWPAVDMPDFSNIYAPISSLPANIRELYEYKPEKAKQLLAEAGYPNGFKAEVLGVQAQADWLMVVQNYWSKIGVDLLLDIKEPGTVASMRVRRQYTQMYAGSVSLSLPYMLFDIAKGASGNNSMVDDPQVEAAAVRLGAAWPDQTRQGDILKEYLPYIWGQSFWTVLVAPSNFVLWWPWLANYNGEGNIAMSVAENAVRYLWVDQDLKKKMGK